MARAHTIWILRNCRTKVIVGAWTVKHELVTYLKTREMPQESIEIAYEVVKLRDGKADNEIPVAWEEILE